MPFLYGLWANRPDDVYAVGGQYVYYQPGTAAYAHFDGCMWTITERPDLALFMAVWGAASNDVWMGGNGGTAYHWDGTMLTPYPITGASSINSFSGTSSTDVWAVGSGGIFHWNGSEWTTSSGGFASDVWAVTPTDVWAAAGGSALHFDGLSWTATSLASNLGLLSIWSDGTQAYAVGQSSAIFRFAGGVWTPLQSPIPYTSEFYDIGGLGADIFTVGINQPVVRLSGATFMTVPDASLATQYWTVWVSPTQIWIGSASGFVARRPR